MSSAQDAGYRDKEDKEEIAARKKEQHWGSPPQRQQYATKTNVRAIIFLI